MFGEVVNGDEGRDIGFEIFQVVVMVGLDPGVLGRAVYPLGLAVGPRVVRLSQPVLYGVCHADAIVLPSNTTPRAGRYREECLPLGHPLLMNQGQ